MKKVLAIVLTLVMILCIFGNCFAKSTENLYEAYGRELKLNPADSLNGQYAGQKLTVFCATGEFPAPLQESAAEFNRLTGAEVEIVVYSWEELVSKISLALNGDEEMDAFCFVSAFEKTFSTLGQLADLTELSEKYGVADYNWEGFIPGLLSRTSDKNGHVFAIPYQMCDMMTYYRKDILGDTLPNDMEGLASMAAEYTKSLNPDSPTTYGYLTLYAGQSPQWSWTSRLGYYGGSFADDDWNIQLADNDAAAKAIESAKQMLPYAPESYTEYNFDEVNTLMAQGEVLIAENWSSAAPYNNSGEMEGKIGYANTTGNSPTLSGWSLAINAKSEKQELAWKFLEFCSTEDGEMTRVDNGLPPARTANYEYLIANNVNVDFYTALLNTLSCTGTWGDVCLPYLGTQGNAILADWTMKAYTNEITAEEAVSGMVADLNESLESVGITH